MRYSVKRPDDEQEVEFLTSSETWFRPINLSVGPDGALYIVDMYREIIEDYSAIPRYLQQQYGLIEGHQRGRIWRVVPTSKSAPRVEPNLGMASTAMWVESLRRDNRWWQCTAQQELVERNDSSSVTPLVELLTSGKRFSTRLHALGALDGLGVINEKILTIGLGDPHFALRMHSIRLATPFLPRKESLLLKVLAMEKDPEPRVRLQLAFSLGERALGGVSLEKSQRLYQNNDVRVLNVLAAIAFRDGEDAWMRSAILSSVPECSGKLFQLLSERPDSKGRQLFEPLASVVGSRGDASEIAELLRTIDRVLGPSAASVSALKGLLAGLQRDKFAGPLPETGAKSLAVLVSGGSTQSRNLSFGIAREVNLAETPEMKTIFAEAVRDVSDMDLSVPKRQEAMEVLANADFPLLSSTVSEILTPGQPSLLQLTAVKMIASTDEESVAEVLLSQWRGYAPKVRGEVINAIFRRTDRLPRLLDAIEQGNIGTHEIDTFHLVQLRQHPDLEIAQRAQTLLSKPKTGVSDEVLGRYVAALDHPRNLSRGQTVFNEICSKCHQLGGVGHTVGPDLAAAKGRADETLLLDILRPSQHITVGYQSYSVVTIDGRVITGILTSETATSITLRKDGGLDQIVLRSDIDEMIASRVSMMPQGMEKQITPDDASHLIGFLRQSLGPITPNSLVLFDENLNFPSVLDQGTGTVRIAEDDAFVGKSCLLVTPPQRFSPRIDGWEFRIRELPESGEFRYLRFAWMTSDGVGIMLELADDGEWPNRNESQHRYFSGSNTTRWKAVRISPDAPKQWTVITRDLWKDFGDLTLTGISPTAMGGEARFDRIELLRSLEHTD